MRTRGIPRSTQHILRLVESSDFITQLSKILQPTCATIQSTDIWQPNGCSESDEKEVQLEWFRLVFPDICWTDQIEYWWLIPHKHGKIPNWDLTSTCTIHGKKGLVLVEAKAHVKELKKRDLCRSKDDENRTRIYQAINEANQALGTNLSMNIHYQLANRVAFSWKIASLGIPVILIYIGFIGDTYFHDQLRDDAHWQQVMLAHMSSIPSSIPEGFTDHWIDCGQSSMQMIIRSLSISQLT